MWDSILALDAFYGIVIVFGTALVCLALFAWLVNRVAEA